MLFARLTTLACLAAAWFSSSEAKEYYDVSCPGVNGDLKCPDGQFIDEVQIDYGNKKDADCNARNQPAAVSTNDCIEPIMKVRLASTCHRLNHCIMPKPNSTLFHCDKSPDNFLQYTYTCTDDNPDEFIVKTCEGDSVLLKCEQGSIHIKKALFGRVDQDTCSATPGRLLYCTSYGADSVIRDHCNGKTECQLKAVSDQLGCPSHCDSLPKYLLVRYTCE
ncbi:L-rhamnose-binding lectin CSL3-like [Antennarius striatus]|uniref:L-rhamnose-binding lectin CSL3-like n=1 Tax=Antennarius striatus TaxID=241820 RepID=UPI0035B2ECDD